MASFCSKSLRNILGLALLGLALVGLSAQEIPLSDATYRDLKKNAENSQRLFTELYGGKVAYEPKNKTHIDAVNAVARFQVYSLAYPPNQVNKTDQGPELMKRVKDCEDIMKAILNSDKSRVNTQAMVDTYYSAIINNAATVAKSDVLVCRVNAIRLLGSVGSILSTRDDQTLKGIVEPQVMIKMGDLLLDRLNPILAKAGDEATRIWALHGIKDALKANQILREGRPVKSLTPAKEVEALKLAAQVITSPPSYVTGSAKGGPEVEGYKIIRREAIRALANGSTPMLPGDFRTVQILGNCLLAEGLNPEVRLDEQVEAAAGLARLAPLDRNDPDYVPEYSMYWIGRFLQNYSRVYVETAKSALPWKTQAARLIESITYFRQRYPRNKFIQELAEIYIDFLTGIEKGSVEPKGLPNIEEKLSVFQRDPNIPKRFFRSKPDSTIVEKMGG